MYSGVSQRSKGVGGVLAQVSCVQWCQSGVGGVLAQVSCV